MSRKIYQQFNSANIIGVTLEHNGFGGGNASHGGFVKLTIENLSSTYMTLNGNDCNEFELIFKGDSERETFLSALKMIVKELEENTNI
jgi:hypothetical protein